MSEVMKNILDKYPEFEATIGIEVHVQLKTNSKIFCSCPNKFGDEPNKNICPVCAGYPGVLPTLNKRVVDFAIMLGLATNCKINETTKFARKHYMYPDLPKNFQITQENLPICENGFVPIELSDGTEKKVHLTRIHMEEDAGKAIHADEQESYIDLNRAGTPLLEIVSEPDIKDAHQAKAYLMRLRNIVRYLGISEANMEEGSFRGDINVSVKLKTDKQLGTKVELKNINSFKFITQAIDFEIERQIEQIKIGQKIKQETRLWDNQKRVSIFMRSKEEAQDYRYLEEPDLPLLHIKEKWLKRIKSQLPELPDQKIKRFQKDYELSLYDAEILTNELELADFFEKTTKLCNEPKHVCNWMLRNLLAYLHENKLTLSESKFIPEKFAELIGAIAKGVINTKVAQDVFLEMAQSGKSPNQIIKEQGLEQIGSSEELENIILEVIKNSPEQVKEYLSGKDRLFTFFVGQAMKATRGKGNPKIIEDLIKKHLKK
jgi:aspartyl-tRNA(Asn)/glutamyl-tRNA(Gln) amidotransferase subunit B